MSLVKTKAQRLEAAKNLVRLREMAQAVESGTYEIDETVIARAAKAAYQGYLKAIRADKNASTPEWRSLSYPTHWRWATIARAVIESALTPSRIETQRSSASGVQRVDVGPRRLRSSNPKAATQKPANRARRSRRG